MRVITAKQELRRLLEPERRAGRRIGLVPTMGFLHAGHASLLRAARRSCEVVVMSAFVNPTQFGPEEGFESYPRDPERDAEIAEREGVDLVYAPEVGDVYPDGFSTSVRVDGVSEVLCGHADRRGIDHFSGVTTVVAKLLNIVGPDIAFFGQKDAQQAVVIKRMVRDLDFPVEIEVLPTVREPDGLAISSRNVNLQQDERERAGALHRTLEAIRDDVDGGEIELAPLLERAAAGMREVGIVPEYLEARDAEDLTPVARFNGRPVLVAVAAMVGDTRLIDNIVIEPEEARA